MTESGKVVDILQKGAAYLEKRGVQQPRLICELLASRLLKCKRLELYLKFDAALSDKQLSAMRRGIKRAADGEPVQYIIGHTDFMGHCFKVDARALIPRPETEGLVEDVLKCEALWKEREERPAIVEIGVGCGCVIISLALAKPGGKYLGLDISAEAIELARENVKNLGLEDKIVLACAEMSEVIDPETVNAIVANLPYISTVEYEALPVHIRDHEPRIALDGGLDGLDIIRAVVQDAAIVLIRDGFLFLEIGEKQGEAVVSLLAETGYRHIEVHKDFAGKDRVVVAQFQ